LKLSGCHFRAILIFAKNCPQNAPRHFENYIFAHIASFKHTLALKIGIDNVFDATNPKMKSDLQKNEDFNEILAKNEISRGAPLGAPKVMWSTR